LVTVVLIILSPEEFTISGNLSSDYWFDIPSLRILPKTWFFKLWGVLLSPGVISLWNPVRFVVFFIDNPNPYVAVAF
jgi:hypothetical protein